MIVVSLTTPTAMLAAIALCCAGLIFVRLQNARQVRGFEDIAADLRAIARQLKRGKLSRDQADILITAEREGVPLLMRFSHSESAPGVYIRCAAEATFSLTFVARTAVDTDAPEVIRTGDSAFDMRFAGRTDNRARAKAFLAQPKCQEHLQQLCCSNKTMLRLAEDGIELSEALIPSDTEHHVVAHLESLIVLKGYLGAIRTTSRRRVDMATVRSLPLFARVAIGAAVALVVVGIFMWQATPETVDANSPESAKVFSVDGVPIPNPSGWATAQPADFDPEFVAWLKTSGVTPEARIALDAHGDGSANSVVYVLQASSGKPVKRVVWILDRGVVCDVVGQIDGITRIPKENMGNISWAEGAAPTVAADGDGLLIVRDRTKPESATVYFTGQRMLHTAKPADFTQISVL